MRGASDRLSDTQKITEEMQSSEETETLSLHIAPVLGPCLVPVHPRTSHTPRQSDHVRPTAETEVRGKAARGTGSGEDTHSHADPRACLSSDFDLRSSVFARGVTGGRRS